MPAPVFAVINFDKADNPYTITGEGYVQKLGQLSDNFSSLATYVAEVELSVEGAAEDLAQAVTDVLNAAPTEPAMQAFLSIFLSTTFTAGDDYLAPDGDGGQLTNLNPEAIAAATTESPGVTILETSIESESEETAATPLSVKQAYDTLNEAKQAALESVSEEEALGGVETTGRIWTSERVKQAVLANLSTGVETQTDSFVLTSSSAALQLATPSGFFKTITLADATTVQEGSVLHLIENKGGYPYTVKNNGGSDEIFIPPFSTLSVTCSDNSTSDGVWEFVGGSYYIDEYAGNVFTATNVGSSTTLFPLELDSDRELLILNGNSATYAVVLDKTTGLLGSPTLVVSGNTSYTASALKIDIDKAVVFYNDGTNSYAALMTFSGTAITLNSAASVSASSLSGNSSWTYNNPPIAIGSTYLFTMTGNIFAVTVSGTTCSIAKKSVTGSYNAVWLRAISGSAVLAISKFNNSNVYFESFTISGTTLTSVSTTSVVTNSNVYSMCEMGGAYGILYADGSNAKGAIVSLSGTTLSTSTVTLSSAFASFYQCFMYPVSATEAACVYMDSSSYSLRINILANSSGTAVAGTFTEVCRSGATSMVAFGGKNGKWLGGLVKSATLHGFSVSSVGGDPKVEFGGGLVGNDYSSAQLTPSHGLYDFPTSGLLGEKTRGTLSAGYPNSYFAGGGWDMGDYVVQRNGSGDKISPSARWGMNSIMQSNPYMTVVNKQRVI